MSDTLSHTDSSSAQKSQPPTRTSSPYTETAQTTTQKLWFLFPQLSFPAHPSLADQSSLRRRCTRQTHLHRRSPWFVWGCRGRRVKDCRWWWFKSRGWPLRLYLRLFGFCRSCRLCTSICSCLSLRRLCLWTLWGVCRERWFWRLGSGSRCSLWIRGLSWILSKLWFGNLIYPLTNFNY